MKRAALLSVVLGVLLAGTATARPWYQVVTETNDEGQVVQKFVVGETEGRKCRISGSYLTGIPRSGRWLEGFSARSRPTFRIEIPANAELVTIRRSSCRKIRV